MRYKSIIVGLALLYGIVLPAVCQYKIHITVDSMPTPKAYLLEFKGAKATNIIDSVRVKGAGNIDFVLDENAHPGMYRVVMGGRTWLDFIFNKENINLHTYFNTPADSLRVVESLENKLFLDYMNFFIVLNRKKEALVRLMNLYPNNSSFFKTLNREFELLQQTDPDAIGKKIIKEHPETYVARFLQIESNLEVPVGLSLDEELEYVLEHYFDNTDFNDASLIYSPPLVSKVQRYFHIIQQAFPPEKVEDEMINGLNKVLSLAAVNDEVYDFLLQDIERVYERSEFETFFAYLTENFLLDAACTDEGKNEKLAEILASIKKTSIGKKAPEIILPLENGPLILSEIKAPYVLVLFWASWCPHCSEILPEIKKIYKQYRDKGFEIVAISLDKDSKEYQKALKEGRYPWINYSELRGWDCSIAYDYGIRATPTMILLDKDDIIISKPRNAQVLRSVLEGLL